MEIVNSGAAANSTYRYLRLGIVVVIITLFASLIVERARASCLQTSISSYYYTPVHAIFIAAFGVAGVALIAIRGGSNADEALMNLAGFLAPIVAFVPTGWSGSDCPSNPALSGLKDGFQADNLLAYLAGGAAAVGLAVVTSILTKKQGRLLSKRRTTILPLVGAVVLVITGAIWYFGWRGSFDTHAHSYSAIAMFALVGVVIVRAARRGSGVYRSVYWSCAAVMATGVAVAVVGFVSGWRYTVLVLEVIETIPFVAFWFAQSIELWDADGISPQTQNLRVA